MVKKNKDIPQNILVFVCFSGTYWTRTSDLCRVKAAL